MLRELTLEIVQALVDQPEQARVRETQNAAGVTVYLVEVAPSDRGKVIGKQGRIADALRTVIKSAAMKGKQKVYIEIVDA